MRNSLLSSLPPPSLPSLSPLSPEPLLPDPTLRSSLPTPPLPSPGALPRLLTLEETAAHLSFAVGTVARLARAGQLPALKIGGSWRVVEPALVELIKRRTAAVGTPTAASESRSA